MDLYQNIEKFYSALTSRQKEVADYLISHPEDICYISLKSLSERLSVSELTILRMCKKLGFENYIELKNAFRIHTQNLVKNSSNSNFFILDMPVSKPGDKEELLHQICVYEQAKSTNFYSSLDCKAILQAAGKIISAKDIFICFHGISKLLADGLAMHLSRLGIGCSYIHPEDTDSVQANLVRMKPGDLLVSISFPKYFPVIRSVAEYAEGHGVEVIAITDSPNSPAVSKNSLNFICNTSTKLFYNSLSLPVALINLLASGVVIEMGAKYDDLVKNAYDVVNFINDDQTKEKQGTAEE